MTKRIGVLVLLAALNLSVELEAQVAGTISGYVRDESGAVVPGADVKAILVGQQLTRSAVSDGTGFFNLLAMPGGSYEITAQLPGFATQRTTAELTAGENLRVDFKMNLSQLQETVEVSGSAALVETRSATISGLVDDRRVQELPLNGRNVVELARTLPGVTDVNASEEMKDTRGGPTMIVHGASRGQNNFTLNGANFTNFSQTAGFNPPPPDAIQEIRVQTSAFSAEFGNNAGAQVSMVTKAGTNQFHGSAWEFFRNDKLNARSFFQPRRPQQRQNQPGVAAGGRIRQNKLFYFGSYQRLSDREEAGSAQALVPTDAQRLGDFSALGTALKNPEDPNTHRGFTDASGTPCVSANIVNPNCISPVAKNYLDRFVPRSPSGVFVKLSPSPFDAYTWMTRVDYIGTPSNNMFVHYFRDHYARTTSPGNVPYVDQNSLNDVKQYSVTDTHTFSPTFLNEATHSYMNADSFVHAIQRVPPRDVGINLDEGYLGVGMSLNVGNGQVNLSFPGPERQVYRNWQWRDTMTLIKGQHTLKWGYEGMYITFDLIRGNGARSATFTGTRSGSPMSDFLLGAFDRVSFGFGAADSFPIEWKHQAFFQDELKVTPRLTLDLGVRYEPWFPWKQKYGRYTSWKPGVQSVVKPDAPPGLLFVGDPGVPQKTVEGNLKNIAPRFGLAWDLFGNGRTVIRSGYGLYFNQVSGTTVHAAEAPWTGTVQLSSGRIEDPFGSLGRTLPPSGVPISGDFGCVKRSTFPGIGCALYPLPLNFVYTDPKMKTPAVQHFNLSFQRQLTKDLMVDIAYVGRLGYHLEGHRHFNPAQYINDPFTGLPPSAQNSGDRVLFEPGIIGPTSRVLEARYQSWYHGLEIKANKRFTDGFMFSGFYTLSKAMDNLLDSQASLTAGVANPFDLSSMKGRAQFDRRHMVGFSWLWEQRRRFGNRLVEGLLGGWAVSGVHNISSGIPLNFVMGTDVALDGTNGDNRQLAQLAPGVTYRDIELRHQNTDAFISTFFNKSAFVPVNELKGIYGNMGRNVISGPAMAKTDLAVMRNFKLPGREGLHFQVRGELFNAFNQVNFDPPNQVVSSGSFGRITSAQLGRVGQLVAKLLW